MKKKINVKILIICIIIPLVVGGLSSLFMMGSNQYNDLLLPTFAPPGWLFPVMWTILYILMGTSCYLIFISNDKDKNKALIVYALQLFVNSLWTLFFFRLEWYLFSFFWLILLLVLIIYMIYCFFPINKKASLLQIPYLIWVLFASYLNLGIYILNR